MKYYKLVKKRKYARVGINYDKIIGLYKLGNITSAGGSS